MLLLNLVALYITFLLALGRRKEYKFFLQEKMAKKNELETVVFEFFHAKDKIFYQLVKRGRRKSFLLEIHSFLYRKNQ